MASCIFVYDHQKAFETASSVQDEIIRERRSGHGLAELERLERRRELLKKFDPPQKSKMIRKNITKQTTTRDNIADAGPVNLNTSFCKPCQRLFSGLRKPPQISYAKTEREGYYDHWNGCFLEKSAHLGCPLCGIVWQVYRTAREKWFGGEEMPSFYDFGNYVGFDSTQGPYAIRFFHWTLIRETFDRHIVPCQLPMTVVTVHPSSDFWRHNTRPLSSSSGSAQSLQQLAHWVEKCDSRGCCRPHTAPYLIHPKLRLVCVEEPIRLVASRNIDRSVKYMTLSHCWGKTHRVTLTHSLLKQFENEIPADAIMKTFREAIEVTRSLGVRYLWIDSLCIIQDSKDDWIEQAAIMCEVYANFYLNVSATASYDSTQGLFRDRKCTKPTFVTVPDGHPEILAGEYFYYWECGAFDAVESAPLNQRGWVLQERLLSPRIIHFCKQQMFWECQGCQACEMFPKKLPPLYDFGWDRLAALSSIVTNALPPDELLLLWSILIVRYTRCTLTYSSDKLIAISALARKFFQLSDGRLGRYIAGIWEKELPHHLLWSLSIDSTHKRAKHENVMAPSWSWASMGGDVCPRLYLEGDLQIARIDGVSLDPSTADMFGAKVIATLRISAPVYVASGLSHREVASASESDVLKDGQACLLPVELPQSRDEEREDVRRHLAELAPGSTMDTVEEIELFTAGNPTPSRQWWARVQGESILIKPQPRPQLRAPGPWMFRSFKVVLDSKLNHCEVDMDEEYDPEAEENLKCYLVLVSIQPDIMYSFTLSGLVVTPEEGNQGTFRRMGTWKCKDKAAAELFCEMANQDDTKVPTMKNMRYRMPINKFLPERWWGLKVDFLPNELTCHVFDII